MPDSLLVIGGGYVGLEMAQAFRRFGSTLTVISRDARLLQQEDDDVTEALQRLLEDEGIRFVLNAGISRVSGKSGKSVTVLLEQDGVTQTFEGSHLLVATGRTPNTQGARHHAVGNPRILKALVEIEGERILGFTALGVGAGEIMTSVPIAMAGALPYSALRDCILTHPTLVEGLLPLFSSSATIPSGSEAELTVAEAGAR